MADVLRRALKASNRGQSDDRLVRVLGQLYGQSVGQLVGHSDPSFLLLGGLLLEDFNANDPLPRRRDTTRLPLMDGPVFQAESAGESAHTVAHGKGLIDEGLCSHPSNSTRVDY